MLVFGTRPEAIKMSPVINALKDDPDYFDVCVCITAQHRQMLDQVLDVFQITPDVDLDIMDPSQDLFDITSTVLLEMKKVFDSKKPDIILVHGDTTTMLASSIAAFYAGIPVGHIEAGLRTNNLNAPFPEEFNRQVASKISKWHFTPTDLGKKNLICDGVHPSSITVTGNTVVDALFWVLDRVDNSLKTKKALSDMLNKMIEFNWRKERFVMITGHRRENFGDGFLNICQAIKALASKYSTTHFLYPVHMNPNVQKPVNQILKGFSNIHLIKPLTYEPFIYLLKHSHIVLTDSGGIQEEAPSLGKPVLVMRDLTERPEAVEAGTVRLVGTDKHKIIQGVQDLLDNKLLYKKMSKIHNPYGDGKASKRILKVLKSI
ncbi:MAG: UDP-N-acetylglucosamine 2-epimerase (non-hydrolyzing) [Pelagibacteraceae bacterium TMED65]|nr:MAG: UDP-N-acetylglucosamine 2-epimerase (non-hydrolyzing) [Pelagibacteraceae bacterium TMED65]|tara:strand:- start:280 stop:1404 length:1125 start_codon:yes stop_codon:yes gene_type:complete